MASSTRREFLAGGAAFGGLLATSQLPSFAADDPTFEGRGKFERLSIVAHHIDAGAEKPFSLLHISDTHLTAAYPHESEWTRKKAAQRVRTFGGRQEESLRDSLAWAKIHTDYVLHTGDLIDFQSEANLDLAKKYYGVGGSTMFGSLGNHEFYHGQKRTEECEAGKAATRAKLAAAYPFDISLQSTVCNGVDFVTFDNVYGTVTAEQATRFEAEAKKGLPMILCMHCPFNLPELARAGSRYWHWKNFKAIRDVSNFKESYRDKTTTDFVAWLKSLKQLKAILCGHMHVTMCDRFSPTAMEYVVGGNYLFHGADITIS